MPVLSQFDGTLYHFVPLRLCPFEPLHQPALRYPLYAIVTSTTVENSLQISYFLCKTNPISRMLKGT